MNKVYILLGANLGNPIEQLRQAEESIAKQLGKIITRSAVYESDAWGVEEQPVFLNQVLLIETALAPAKVLHTCQEIEQSLGRIRKEKWEARLIDIDILYFNDEQLDLGELIIPHPYLHLRRFTLVPLCEIAPDHLHPLLQKTTRQLLTSCTDSLSVKKLAIP